MMFPAACIFDTESDGNMEDFSAGVEALTKPPEIQYPVADHLELDHRGCLVIPHCHGEPWPWEAVRTGETISGEA
jgi:flavorubredoxin